MSFTIQSSGFLLARIEEQLADNNAGLISAADVRNNIGDAVRSINAIVASGDTNSQFPFYQDVRAKVTVPLVGSAYGGTFIAESGIRFPNAPFDSSVLQVRPYPGPQGIQHNELAGLTTGHPHTQYLKVDGTDQMEGNLAMDDNWIGASGYDGEGFKFLHHPTGTTILTSGTLKFPDNSRLGSAIGVAKAFGSFDVTNAAHYYSYGIHSITRHSAGKYSVQVNSGILGTDDYVVIAQSNARSTVASPEDFDRNTACSVVRSGVNPSTGRVAFSVNILNENGSYADGKILDVVVFASGV
jgi:hypothetical protein